MGDEIKAIAGYEKYGVDASGNTYVRSGAAWETKHQINGKNGYHSIALWCDGKERRAYVHHLVLEAFVGPRPVGMETLHRDGNRKNNSLGNLRWGSRSENVADMVAHGTATIGSKNKMAKLSPVDVSWIRDLYATGFTVADLKKHWCVSQETLRRVVKSETYKKETTYVV